MVVILFFGFSICMSSQTLSVDSFQSWFSEHLSSFTCDFYSFAFESVSLLFYHTYTTWCHCYCKHSPLSLPSSFLLLSDKFILQFRLTPTSLCSSLTLNTGWSSFGLPKTGITWLSQCVRRIFFLLVSLWLLVYMLCYLGFPTFLLFFLWLIFILSVAISVFLLLWSTLLQILSSEIFI